MVKFRDRILAFALAFSLATAGPGRAGDLLRAGAGATPGGSASQPGSVAAPAVSSAGHTNAVDSLARATQALQAVQAMQAAARALAATGPVNLGFDPNHPGLRLPDVPDGLAHGGLSPRDTATWQGAGAPVQATSDGKTTVTVEQTSQQALLTWDTFNIGRNTTLVFDQSRGDGDVNTWIAFNKINDPSGIPSQILGSIRAPGQVYVINQNGIIFGGTAQVNTHTFVASSLPINDHLVARGLLNNPDQQFLFSSVALAAGASGTPAFTPPAAATPTGQSGDIVVQAGATLASPTTPEHVGGRIALFGPNVTNAGTISTPDGQVILAAGQQVGLAAHDSNDPSLRGLDAFVGVGGGKVTNAAGALIEAPRASILLAGRRVDQLGAITSTTSVAFNGRIDLLADYDAVSSGGFTGLPSFFPTSTGEVNFGPASLTQVLPEWESKDRVVGTQLALSSEVKVRGRSVYFAPQASLLAPSGNLTIDAGGWNLNGSGATAQDYFAYTGGQIYLDAGATIDVSGSSNVAASVAENIISVELRGAELANSPLQRDGALRGQTVKVDIRDTGTYNGQAWVGTPLADATGYVALVDRTVGELTTGGGNAKLSAGNAVVVQSGAAINVSGGWINYAGGVVQTTKLLADGRVIDIADATPDRVYDGIYTGGSNTTNAKWGVTDKSTNPQLDGAFEAGYVQGGRGGALAITAPALALDGALFGSTVAGARQRSAPPTPAALSLAFKGQDPALPQNLFPFYSPTPPQITFAPTAALPTVGAYAVAGTALPDERRRQVVLSPTLLGDDSFGSLTIDNPDGRITVAADVSLAAPVRGAVTFSAANIDVAGRISAPGGGLGFTVYDRSPFADRALSGGAVPAPPVPDPTRGAFTLGATGVLSVAGQVVDDRGAAGDGVPAPIVTRGGTVSITSYAANLAAGSLIDAGGGVFLSPSGKPTYGDGGAISIKAGQDPAIASLLGGQLAMGATLTAYSGAKGGSLTLSAPLVQIGGSSSRPGTLLLAPEFFSEGGFTRFSVNGLGALGGQPGEIQPGLLIAPGTVITPMVTNRLLASGAGDEIAFTTLRQEQGVRTPVSVSLAASGVRDPFNVADPIAVRGDLVMGEGSKILTDPNASVSLSGDTVLVRGSITAPGGTIAVSGGKDSAVLFDDTAHPQVTVDLASGSVLSTAGATILTPDPRGIRAGRVLPGGSINVSGNLAAERGATLDVSGATGVLDLAPSFSASGSSSRSSSTGGIVVPTRIDSDGGSISLAGAQELFVDATLLGGAGGPSAVGGSLALSSGRYFPPGTSAAAQTPLDVTLTVTQSTGTIPAQARGAGQSLIGAALLDAQGAAIAGQGYFGADTFNRSGFDALTLKGTVRFSGPVTLDATRSLAVATNGVVFADGAVSLNAPYVALGTAFQTPLLPQEVTPAFLVQGQPFYAPATFGSGSLTVQAKLIDVGSLSLQNIGRAMLAADDGDIRGDGTLEIMGDLTLRAGQVYPPSAISFTIAAFDSVTAGIVRPGSVTIAASGTRPTPLSAGGTLNIFGSTVVQGGVLRAPAGAINLGWDGAGAAPRDLVSDRPVASTQQLTLTAGSVTSVSAIDSVTGQPLTIPYGVNLNGNAWIDPTSADITVSGPPAKSVHLSAQTVNDQAGATVDLQGGGDLSAYRWVSGVGGTKDILVTSNSFAVVPGYQAGYAPFAPFNPTALNQNLGGDTGYANAGLAVGDQIYLGGTGGLPAGVYTLLPARYALLPGAFLVTPRNGLPPDAAVTQPDGATVVPGYRFNDLSAARTATPLAAAFEVAPQSVIRKRAQYDDFSANAFLSASATAHDAAVPRLPVDAGQLVLNAVRGMTLQGSVKANAPEKGRGGLVDISSPVDIFIGAASDAAPAGTLSLSAGELSAFGAQSLLIGGVRRSTTDGEVVDVTTNRLTLANAGTALKGADIILVANQSLTLAAGAAIEATGTSTGAAKVIAIGSGAQAGSGDGAVVRVSRDAGATVERAGVDATGTPTLVVGAGARLSGGSVTLDSTRAMSLDSSAVLDAGEIFLGSGQITLQLQGLATTADGGLVLSGAALQSLQKADRLSLLSYSTIDIHGSGQIGGSGADALASLSLHAAAIRGFDTAGGTVTFSATELRLDNAANAASPTDATQGAGALVFNAGTVRLGAKAFRLENFTSTTINASAGIIGEDSGELVAQGTLNLITPFISGAAGANQSVEASGALTITSSGGANTGAVNGGLGASFSLSGASVSTATDFVLPSGRLTLHATNRNLAVGGGRLDVSGTTQTFYDLTKFTAGGAVTLAADAGSIDLAAGALVAVAAPGGATPGTLTVQAPDGVFTTRATLLGSGGSFSLDVGTIPGESLAPLNAALNAGGFTAARDLRVRGGNVIVDSLATAHAFNLSADRGAITVTGGGAIDAFGDPGGAIGLEAGGAITLQSGARLTVAAQDFDAAGKGGTVRLETRGEAGAVIDVQAGSLVELSVAGNTTEGADRGKFAGTLHLRAPQTESAADVQIAPLAGTIRGASSVVIEGFRVFDLSSPFGSTITSTTQTDINANGTAFTAHTAAISSRLLASQPATVAAALHIRPGAEIVNRTGDLTLGAAWDLSTWRFGLDGREPGALTLRAAGNLNFDYSYNSVTRVASAGTLSDGFGGASTYGLWDAPLLAPGSLSWSYRLVAGADLAAADFRRVRPIEIVGAQSGSLLLGRNSPPVPLPNNPNQPNNSADLRETIIPTLFQTIRTGTGDIDIYAARDVQLLNPLATVYTAGTQAAPLANFDTPNLTEPIRNSKLGRPQNPIYGAQFSLAGGNVTISAQRDIARYVMTNGALAADSSKELPTNWLYRRGYVDPSTGQFGATHPGGEVASTAWWIDFSNFFADVGALGGGNVSLVAGGAVTNIDAAVPTNARMPKGTPDAANLLELGGGDLTVRAGRDIDGGVYYVERGRGTLVAGGSVRTNSTRAALTQSDVVALDNQRLQADPATWLPTTLFLGKGSFAVTGGADVLLGAMANPFLLPQGVNNNAYEKTYFSTFAADSAVDVSSLTGSLTLRDSADGRTGSLADWFANVLLYDSAHHQTFSSYSQPWLRLLETDITPFYTAAALTPGTLRATAFTGDLNLVGSLTLSPSPQGTVELVAAKSVNALQVNGLNTTTQNRVWGTGVVNLSDADPWRVPGVTAPITLSVAAAAAPTVTPLDLLVGFNLLFNESGSTQGLFGAIQTRQALHSAGPLHANDFAPARIYAGTGDISGLTFFSAKQAQVFAGRDITDVSLYLQNVRATDGSVVAAGRDLVAFAPNSRLRVAARAPGNELLLSSLTAPGPGTGNPTAGDIQISGPGTLEVLAGRNFDLGVGPPAGDGTAVGITSIGNARNPNLPFAGADIIAAAGIGPAAALGDSRLDFGAFEAKFLDPSTGGGTAKRYLAAVRDLLDLKGSDDVQTWTAYSRLAAERRHAVALDVFYRVLRDAGRDHGDPASPGFRNYDAGFAAIATLFPGTSWQGNFSLTSREIKTASGGDIRVLAPGGKLVVGIDVPGSQPVDQGILTEAGGSISIFTHDSVIVGTSRIFTLRGGNEVIWSSAGNIAAGASSKTVQSAPPTRVLVDPQSGDVKTDLAGLATGGGIGVLATVAGVPPGDVDLIAPAGTIDAGDAGIRVSGNLNVSALQVVNAANIQVSGASVGTPTVAAPNIGGLLAAAGSTAAATNAANEVSRQNQGAAQPEKLPSIITVEVIGYGGGEGGAALARPADGATPARRAGFGDNSVTPTDRR